MVAEECRHRQRPRQYVVRKVVQVGLCSSVQRRPVGVLRWWVLHGGRSGEENLPYYH